MLFESSGITQFSTSVLLRKVYLLWLQVCYQGDYSGNHTLVCVTYSERDKGMTVFVESPFIFFYIISYLPLTNSVGPQFYFSIKYTASN